MAQADYGARVKARENRFYSGDQHTSISLNLEFILQRRVRAACRCDDKGGEYQQLDQVGFCPYHRQAAIFSADQRSPRVDYNQASLHPVFPVKAQCCIWHLHKCFLIPVKVQFLYKIYSVSLYATPDLRMLLKRVC